MTHFYLLFNNDLIYLIIDNTEALIDRSSNFYQMLLVNNALSFIKTILGHYKFYCTPTLHYTLPSIEVLYKRKSKQNILSIEEFAL